MELSGRVVIITGASSGIGAAVARLCAAQGATVVLAARRAERLEALAAELPSALAVPTDMRDAYAVGALVATTVERFGRVDVLVNNAGQGLHVFIEDLALDDLDAVMRLNVYAPLLAMQAVRPYMRAQGAGAIVNVSSATSRMAIPGMGGYSATKAALDMLSHVARREWAADGIVVSVVHPRITATEFHSSLRAGELRASIPPDPPERAAEAVLRAIATGDEDVAVGD